MKSESAYPHLCEFYPYFINPLHDSLCFCQRMLLVIKNEKAELPSYAVSYTGKNWHENNFKI